MKSFCLDMVKNPEIFKDNVLPAHGDFRAFATDDELEEGVSSLRISLKPAGGSVRFHGYDQTAVACL